VVAGRDFIGPFQLVRLIRAGQTTQVWEALREGVGDRVALKVVSAQYATDKTEIGQLKHETLVAQTLNHPNVIQIYGYFDDYGLPFISMQLFNARNLKIEVRERPDVLDLNINKIVRSTAEGLAHLHDKGWIHCDIKPDNFLADEQGNVKLIDFSIAEKQKSGFRLFGSRPKKIRGTLSYLSPEQIRRQPLDLRTDIYSFGCMLYELVAGRAPFTGSNQTELLNKHLNAAIPSLQSAEKNTSLEFANLVSKTLSKNPDERPSTMHEFLIEFSRCTVYRAGLRGRSSVKRT
jgi:serine/threonine-protein kinase